MPVEEYYHLLATWDFHTYLLEEVECSPYIWLFAIPERGKSRTGKGVLHVSYRGIHVESLRDAYLIRVANDYRATIFFDVKELWKQAVRAGAEDVLLHRFEKGAVVPRVLYPEKGAYKDIKYFKIFGATIVGTNEPINDILETRSMMVSMPETEKSFDELITEESGLPFRERLVAFRARHIGKSLPKITKPVAGRLGDIMRPLLQMVHLVKPENEDMFLEFIKGIERDRKLQKSESLEAKLLMAIKNLEFEVEKQYGFFKSKTQ